MTSNLTAKMLMPGIKAFIDTNVLVYLFSEDAQKSDQAENIIRSGAVISVQVLNELANVSRRKMKMSWPEVNEILTLIKSLCSTEPLTMQTHDQGIVLAEKYMFNSYDAMIVSTALLSGCSQIYSENMQHDLVVNNTLRIVNPFNGT